MRVLLVAVLFFSFTHSFSQAPKWTWVNGDSSLYNTLNYGTKGIEDPSNNPGFRYASTSWVDQTGNFWLFGGSNGYSEMWKFNNSTNQWSWVSGNNFSSPPVYGTKGVSSATNNPGSVNFSASWVDNSDNLWLFGGSGYGIDGAGYLNTLWKYNPSTLEWTWVNGSQNINQQGFYGTKGVTSSSNQIRSRHSSAFCRDASGMIWVFGGQGTDAFGNRGSMNDLWKYNSFTNQWTWISGSSTINAGGFYGTKGIASASNVPPARELATAWVDNNGNFWLFGGANSQSAGGNLNDLWMYNPSTQQWTWVAGETAYDVIYASGIYGSKGVPSSTNKPGGRVSAKGWKDASGNLWLFGGMGWGSLSSFGELNDVWKYTIATNQWTWMHGSNATYQAGVYNSLNVADASSTPSGRWLFGASSDAAGNFWVYGGQSRDSYNNTGTLDDLWKFNSTSNQWTWKSGSKLIAKPGVYGARGIANNSNQPAQRTLAASRSISGKLLVFGGYGVDVNGRAGGLNDLWEYDPSIHQWKWISGDSLVSQPGVYGVKKVTASTNKPGARLGSVSWKDASGNFWLFGGSGLDQSGSSGQLNDLWKYNTITNEWTWMAGDSAVNQNANYGVKGVSSSENKPGGKINAIGWIDSSGNFWLFGGNGDDLWKYNTITNEWTWMAGSTTYRPAPVYGTKGISSPANTPGTKIRSSGWTDVEGNLWLFGGSKGDDANYNDLWKFNTTTNEWTWVHGDNFIMPPGVYGSKGVASSSNKPSGRTSAIAWMNAKGNFNLYGGRGNNINNQLSTLSEVWEYNPTTNEWTWLSGANTGVEPASYGTKRIYNSLNTPGGRYAASYDTDTSGNLWVFSGSNNINDLWTATASSSLPSAITVLGDSAFCAGAGDSAYLYINKIEGAQYLWLKNDTIIQGATDTGYYATSVGAYSIRVYNTFKTDSVISSSIHVKAQASPAKPIVTANGSLNICNGDSITLTSSAALNYQWYKDGVVLPAEINQTYTASSAGSYFAADSNSCGSSRSEIVLVAVSNTPATITTPPIYFSGDTILCPGGSSLLYTSKITGVSYQWLKDNIPVSTPSTNDTSFIATASGQYSVRIYNTCNNDSATSRAIMVSINSLPGIPTITANGPTTICSVDSVKLTSSSALNYQWYRDGVVIPGTSSQSYTVYGSGSYKVSTSNNCGTSFSDSIVITFSSRPSTPTITLLGSNNICQGDSVQLSTPTVNGLTYQWKKSGADINGAIAATYLVKEPGNYSVTVSNGNCTSTSSSVAVTVNPPPSAPTISASGPGAICPGGSVLLTSSASSGNQWYKDGVLIPSAVGITYDAAVAGVYTIRASVNNCSSTSSVGFGITTMQSQTSINSISATPSTLWPPDHRMVDVQINYVSASNCGTPNCVLSVSSNEPQNGLGGGDVDNDWEIVDLHHIRLRAERGANGNGRIYTVNIKCTTVTGDTTVKTIAVYVQNKPIVVITQSNPTASNFILTVQSSSNEVIYMRVLNMNGILIEQKTNVQRNTPILLGGTYDPGLYYVEFIQGNSKELIKLMKLGL